MNTRQSAEMKTGDTPQVKELENGCPEGTPSVSVQERNRDAGICIVLFLSALFVIIAISSPALFMNDEWITVNQLHQFSTGHQFVTNEGKYGTYPDGTPSAYFDHILNILIYTMALPIVSVPALMAVQFCGDYFRFATVLFWSSLPFFIALTISRCFPEHARLGPVRITILGAGAGAFLFAINRLFYFPFAGSDPRAPVEVTAVVFTSHFFFALIVVMTYLIARRIFSDRGTALFAVLTCTACSSTLLWGGTAKDHMATAAIFAVMLWFFIAYLQSRRFAYAAGGFFTIGILAWFRPEIGLSVFFCLGLFYLIDILLCIRQKQDTIVSGLKRSSAIFFTPVGAIPLFINNILVSGNPLVPPVLFLRNLVASGTTAAVTPVSSGSVMGNQIIASNAAILNSDFLGTLKTYLFSVSHNPVVDLFGILFSPQHGSLGFFIIVPIALLALILLPFLFRTKGGANVIGDDPKISAFLFVATLSVFVAYLNILYYLNTDVGLAPDIRYLIPAYLPATLLGLVLVRKTELLADPGQMFRNTGIVAVLLAVVLVAAVVLLSLLGIFTLSFLYHFISIMVLAEVLFVAVMVYLSPKGHSLITALLPYSLPLLILTVLFMQLFLIIVLMPAAKIEGYSFWLPGADALYYSYLNVVFVHS